MMKCVDMPAARTWPTEAKRNVVLGQKSQRTRMQTRPEVRRFLESNGCALGRPPAFGLPPFMSVSSGGSSAGLSTTSSRESAVQHLNKSWSAHPSKLRSKGICSKGEECVEYSAGMGWTNGKMWATCKGLEHLQHCLHHMRENQMFTPPDIFCKDVFLLAQLCGVPKLGVLSLITSRSCEVGQGTNSLETKAEPVPNIHCPNFRAKAKDGGEEDEDLLEEKRSFQEFCYFCMDTLSAEKAFTDYNVYTNVMYLHVAVVGLLLAGLAVLALTVNKVQKSKDLKKWVKVLHVSTGVSARIHVPGAVRQICNGG
eukprot:1144270-Pelagomonas_calceolata.AAC.1